MAATIWAKPLNDFWQPIGSSRDRGVWHEQLVAISDQWGPKGLSFTLRRQQRAAFPDLLTETPVAVDVDGVRVWRGWISNTPENNGRDRLVNVECAGGQRHLDDDALERILVHTRVADWRDVRSYLAAPLTTYTSSPQVASDNGVVVLSFPANTVVANVNAAGIGIDLGPFSVANRVVVDYEYANPTGNANQKFECFAGSSGVGVSGSSVFSLSLSAASGSGTIAGSPSGTRYLWLHLTNAAGGNLTPTGDVTVRVKAVKAFADTAYESGNASILSARTIIVDALTRATTLLHPDWTGIGDPSFAFPDFAPDAPRTSRELIAAANAVHGWQFKVNEELKPVYRARPTVPVVDLGVWLGAEGDTGSSNSDEGIVTKVIVRGAGPDNASVRSTRTQTGTIIDRQGGVRTKTLDSSYTLTSTLADKLGDAYLAAHRVSPFKGQNTVTQGGARRANAGGTIHPAHLLLLTGELARRTDLVDPDTGALGRTAVIDQVTYRDDDRAAEVDLDNTRRDFEALQERLGILVPA